MILLQFIIAIYNYADTQNTLSGSVAFIFAFYSVNYCHVIPPMKKESTLRMRNVRGISVPSRSVELRFRIIRLQGKSCRTFCRSLRRQISFISFFAAHLTLPPIFAFINTLFREIRENHKRTN